MKSDNRTWYALSPDSRTGRDVEITEAHPLGCRRSRRSSHSHRGGSASDSWSGCKAPGANTRFTRSRDGSQGRWPIGHRLLSELAHYDGECADPQPWL